MRQVPNDIVSTLINKLPSVLAMIDLHNVDNKTFNAVRLINKSLKRLKKIEENKKKKKKKKNRYYEN